MADDVGTGSAGADGIVDIRGFYQVQVSIVAYFDAVLHFRIEYASRGFGEHVPHGTGSFGGIVLGAVAANQTVIQGIASAVKVETITDGILSGDNIDTHFHHLTNAGNTAGAGFGVNAHDGEGLGVGADIDIRLLKHLHNLDGVGLVLVGDGGAVSAGYTALPAMLHGKPGGIFQGTIEHIFGLIDVHIDEAVVFFGHLEDEIHMFAGMLIQHFSGRHATHNIAAHFHGFLQQLIGARIADDTFLRESDDLQIADIFGGFFGHQNTLQSVEVRIQGADIHIGAQFGGTIHDTILNSALSPGSYGLRSILADTVVHDIDGVFQGFFGRRDPVALAIAFTALFIRSVGLIKVHMGIYKGGASHHTSGIDSFDPGGCFDVPGNFLVFSVITDENINDFAGPIQVGVFNQQHFMYLQLLIKGNSL